MRTARALVFDAEGVLDALRVGRLFGSSGPVIRDAEVRDGAVVVRCSPGRSPYGREVVDTAGRRAWTNPLWPV